jgi:hypothetical protein
MDPWHQLLGPYSVQALIGKSRGERGLPVPGRKRHGASRAGLRSPSIRMFGPKRLLAAGSGGFKSNPALVAGYALTTLVMGRQRKMVCARRAHPIVRTCVAAGPREIAALGPALCWSTTTHTTRAAASLGSVGFAPGVWAGDIKLSALSRGARTAVVARLVGPPLTVIVAFIPGVLSGMCRSCGGR